METTDFLMYLRVIWKRAWLIVLIMVMVKFTVRLKVLTYE